MLTYLERSFFFLAEGEYDGLSGYRRRRKQPPTS